MLEGAYGGGGAGELGVRVAEGSLGKSLGEPDPADPGLWQT